MISKWNGMHIDLSGSKASITPAPTAQPRDIGTMQMQRTYEVVRVKPQYGVCYYSPCLLLDGRPTSMHGKMHQYPRTARKALKKWAKQVEADLVNATIVDAGENASYGNGAMWDYHYETVPATRRCYFDALAQIIREEPCDRHNRINTERRIQDGTNTET
jgi:hypothetical protein